MSDENLDNTKVKCAVENCTKARLQGIIYCKRHSFPALRMKEVRILDGLSQKKFLERIGKMSIGG